MLILASSFFIIAWLYASVGLGGGSSYLAILSLSNVPFNIIPSLSLLCNLIVSASGFFHFYTNGHFAKQHLWPLLLGSIPMAFLGGIIPIPKTVFMTLLGISLLLASLSILLKQKKIIDNSEPSRFKLIIIGALIGFFSGLVGIGGGIFLAPIMLSITNLKPKQIAALASAFIFINSSSGFLGQITKLKTFNLLEYWPLLLAVFLGGQVGARISSRQSLSQNAVRKLTALLTFYVGFRLIFFT